MPKAILMKKILLGSLLLLWVLSAFAQATDREQFRLIHADKLYLSNLEKGQILQLIGKVNFFYGDTEFKSDHALILDTQKVARLSGHVVVQNDSLHLVADSLAYYRIPEVLNLGGRARLTQRSQAGFTRWLEGDHAIYDKAKDTFTTWSDVKGYFQDENAFVECGYGFWDRRNGYGYLIEEPKIQAGTTDTLYVSADKMEFYEQERKFIATFNVATQSRDYQAYSDFLIYLDNEEKAVFIGRPNFENSFATATAQEFQLYFDDRELQRITLVDSCVVHFAQEEGQAKQNWVKASNIELLLGDGQIQEFSADSEVSYFYYQEENEKQDFFINRAGGDRLKAKFDSDNKLKLLDMGGRIKGTYKFKNDS